MISATMSQAGNSDVKRSCHNMRSGSWVLNNTATHKPKPAPFPSTIHNVVAAMLTAYGGSGSDYLFRAHLEWDVANLAQTFAASASARSKTTTDGTPLSPLDYIR